MAGLGPDVKLENFDNIFQLDGKVAVVTGGSRGLGLYMASGLLQAGCSKVFIISRKVHACQDAVEALNQLSNKRPGAQAFAIPADLAQHSEVERFVAELSKITKHVDILCANAGASWGSSFEEQPEHIFTKILNLNVKSIFYIVQKMQALLQARAEIGKPSSIIINASVSGIAVGSLGEYGTHAYSVSKAAAIHLARILAVELGPRGINTNAIAPGLYPTKMSSGLINSVGGLQDQADKSPNLRLGKPEDIAALAVFLSSPASSHINGAVVSSDGGTHLSRGKL